VSPNGKSLRFVRVCVRTVFMYSEIWLALSLSLSLSLYIYIYIYIYTERSFAIVRACSYFWYDSHTLICNSLFAQVQISAIGNEAELAMHSRDWLGSAAGGWR